MSSSHTFNFSHFFYILAFCGMCMYISYMYIYVQEHSSIYECIFGG